MSMLNQIMSFLLQSAKFVDRWDVLPYFFFLIKDILDYTVFFGCSAAAVDWLADGGGPQQWSGLSKGKFLFRS